QLSQFESELNDPSSVRHQVFQRYARLLRARSRSPAFHPHGGQQVLDVGDAVFALLRISPEDDERVLCLQNISDQAQRVGAQKLAGLSSGHFMDLFTGQVINGSSADDLSMEPYQTLWLRFNV
ncbi:MAG TPA: hypothetical protein VFY25_13805, partial [Anaerolineales bacterium]|nr:hypothetical protein [Anaerolineales bacterium]